MSAGRRSIKFLFICILYSESLLTIEQIVSLYHFIKSQKHLRASNVIFLIDDSDWKLTIRPYVKGTRFGVLARQ